MIDLMLKHGGHIILLGPTCSNLGVGVCVGGGGGEVEASIVIDTWVIYSNLAMQYRIQKCYVLLYKTKL